MGQVVRTLRPGIRAEGQQPDLGSLMAALKGLDERMQRDFNAFKEQNDKELSEIKAGKRDVVTEEHTSRINASLSELQSQMTQIHSQVTALRVNGSEVGEDAERTTAAKAHARAFNAFVRKGVDADLGALQVKAELSADSNPDGGFFVPETVDTAIGRVQQTVSVFRQLATVTSISGKRYVRRHGLGGTTSGWVGEKDSRTETSTPRIAEIAIEAMEIYAEPHATQEILDDSGISIEAWLADEVGREFADKEAAAWISGTGAKQPRGILSYTFVANASYSTATAADWAKVGYIATGVSGNWPTVSASVAGYDSLVDVYHALKQGLRGSAQWLMADSTLQSVRKLKVNDGGYIYLPPTATEPASVLGKPVAVDDNMPTIAANSYSIGFGDWAQAYRIVDRIGVRVLRDAYTSKPYVKFYTTKRVGGGINNFEALKFLKFGTS